MIETFDPDGFIAARRARRVALERDAKIRELDSRVNRLESALNRLLEANAPDLNTSGAEL